MPAGQDEELAALFRDLREALNASPEVLARQLDTTADVILALEQGNLLGLPPWPETDRIISSYAALLGLDAGPILRRIIAHLQSYAPSGGPTEAPPPPSPVEAAGDPTPALRVDEPPPNEPRPHSLELSSFSLFEPKPPRKQPEPAPKTDPEPRPPHTLQPDPPPASPPSPKPRSDRDWTFEPEAPGQRADPQQPNASRPTVNTRRPGPPQPPEAPKQPPWIGAAQTAANQQPVIPDRTNPPLRITQPPLKQQPDPKVDAAFDWTPPSQQPADPRPIAEPAAGMGTPDESRPKSDEPKSTGFLAGLKPYIASPARLAAIVGVVITIWLIAGNSDRLFSGMPESLQWLTRGMNGDASDDPRNRKADRLPSRY